jgi:hypothetical protein
MGKAHENSLNLVGDGDELDLVESIESAFGIRFVDSELENALTVGDLHQTVLRQMSGAIAAPRRHCRSAAAFRRLRHAFKETTGETVFRSTKVAALIARDREGHVLREIERRANLQLDSVGLSGALVRTCVATVVTAVAIWVLVSPPGDNAIASALVALLTASIGSLAAVLVADRVTGDHFKRLDDRTMTVGDLATRAAHLNFGKLTGRDEHNHPDDVWRTLLWLCRRMTSHDRLIDRETRIVG